MTTSTSICLVAILKNEEHFLDEWLVYHRMIGIDHFFLYDHNPTQPLKDFLIPHINYSTVINYWQIDDEAGNQQDVQEYAYMHALNNYIKEFEWVVFLDGDEFIVLNKHSTIKDFLLDFKNEVSVSLNWLMFGHNGFFNDPNRLITVSLNRRLFRPYSDFKTFTKTNAIADILTPHNCELKYGIRVDANHKPYTDEIYEGKTDIAYINHYHCRSFKTWMRRVERGHANASKWQFYKKESCMEKFVALTRDKNEYIDNSMLKYRYDINQRINQLNRNKTPVIKGFLSVELQTVINFNLKLIAEFFVAKTNEFNNIGLYNGSAGIAVFLFHYSGFTQSSPYHKPAFNLWNDFVDGITKGVSASSSDELACFGIVAEHLVAESFIKIDTDKLLENTDILIKNSLNQDDICSQNFHKNSPLLAEYYLSRFNNPLNMPYYHREEENKQALEDIIERMRLTMKTPNDSLSFLDIICKSYVHRDDKVKAIEQIQQTTALIKGIINSNDNNLFENFNLLLAIEILIKISKIAEDDYYANMANEILIQQENEYWEYLNKANLADGHKFDIGFHYLHLGKMLNKPVFIEKGLNCLRGAIENQEDILFDIRNLKTIIKFGLGLLIIVNEDYSERLLDIAISFAKETDQK